ncbi:hypothetical protein DOTSEDRAFT_55382 [Dothistroma septosporum NZE10]|uniref:SnoaL-like domain-containing protein n=1 Tax=Dothistroma septosporum (strain NZE10 / CBS 128990) TaxID=675120 RepID=N1PJ76_DOTSN|nr:hypothetical protein DOTSEDRAFT_55382 [Dothistroma septosporum NZE10]
MKSTSPGEERRTGTEHPEETDAFIRVRAQALAINHALNTRDFGLLSECLSNDFVGFWAFFPDIALDKGNFIESIRYNAEQYPNWQCKAVDLHLHGTERTSRGQPERVSMMVVCQQTGEPDGIARNTFMILEFGRPGDEDEAAKETEWLCTSLKATQGLVAGDAWLV